jgi:hypothetical protein
MGTVSLSFLQDATRTSIKAEVLAFHAAAASIQASPATVRASNKTNEANRTGSLKVFGIGRSIHVTVPLIFKITLPDTKEKPIKYI